MAPKSKRPYQRPLIERVPLKSDEVVLAACKTQHGSGGPGAGNCAQPTPCVGIGS